MKMELTNEQIQVILTGIFGDGCIKKPQSATGGCAYTTNCKYKNYLDFKKQLLGDLFVSEKHQEVNGYSGTPINHLRSKAHKEIRTINEMSLQECLNLLDELGVALWFYDDGSLHKRNMFYNLNTHAFPKEVQEEFFIPFFNKFNIFPQIISETKKDGRKFWYLYIPKGRGAFEVNQILRKYPVECYKYKLWGDELFKTYEEYKKDGKTNGDIATIIKKQGSAKAHANRKLNRLNKIKENT